MQLFFAALPAKSTNPKYQNTCARNTYDTSIVLSEDKRRVAILYSYDVS